MATPSATDRMAALLFLDLDRFKQVNDEFGHGTGAALLRSVARRLFECVRSGDIVARLGGDEFTVIIERVPDADSAARVAGKIVAALARPFAIDGQRVEVSASVGVAFYAGGPATPKQFMGMADEMLYRAKSAGRNNYQLSAVNAT